MKHRMPVPIIQAKEELLVRVLKVTVIALSILALIGFWTIVWAEVTR